MATVYLGTNITEFSKVNLINTNLFGLVCSQGRQNNLNHGFALALGHVVSKHLDI